jgi:hypothetical protein
MSIDEISKGALEAGVLLAAAKERGDVMLMDYKTEYLQSKPWKKIRCWIPPISDPRFPLNTDPPAL